MIEDALIDQNKDIDVLIFTLLLGIRKSFEITKTFEKVEPDLFFAKIKTQVETSLHISPIPS